MAQNWTDDCFNASNQGLTDLQNMENNMTCLKSNFEGTSAPSNPVKGQSWVDSAAAAYFKLRDMANSAWQTVWDFTNDCIATGKVKTASLADGALSADSTGRAKMADLFITSAKINDVDGSKIVSNSIPTAKIQDNAVSGTKLPNGTTFATGAGGLSVLSADTIRGSSGSTYVKKKEIRVKRAGTWRVSFYIEGASNDPGPGDTVYGRIYKNGSAYGTERAQGADTSGTWTEDLTFAADDDVQLYCKGGGSCKWFRLSIMDPIYGSVTTD